MWLDDVCGSRLAYAIRTVTVVLWLLLISVQRAGTSQTSAGVKRDTGAIRIVSPGQERKKRSESLTSISVLPIVAWIKNVPHGNDGAESLHRR